MHVGERRDHPGSLDPGAFHRASRSTAERAPIRVDHRGGAQAYGVRARAPGRRWNGAGGDEFALCADQARSARGAARTGPGTRRTGPDRARPGGTGQAPRGQGHRAERTRGGAAQAQERPGRPPGLPGGSTGQRGARGGRCAGPLDERASRALRAAGSAGRRPDPGSAARCGIQHLRDTGVRPEQRHQRAVPGARRGCARR